MIIGVPKEIKNNENRVALTPGAASQPDRRQDTTSSSKKTRGLEAGLKMKITSQWEREISEQAKAVWEAADMVMKVKEPLPEEYPYFREGLILFTYLHLAAEPSLAEALKQKGVTAIAYETVSDGRSLPLLTPMSEVAGRMAAQIGAQFLEKPKGGKGILLAGVPGVARGKVTIIGGGVVGTNAAKIAAGLGADVTMIDLSADVCASLMINSATKSKL
jgi:alanine dehydrogenase